MIYTEYFLMIEIEKWIIKKSHKLFFLYEIKERDYPQIIF